MLRFLLNGSYHNDEIPIEHAEVPYTPVVRQCNSGTPFPRKGEPGFSFVELVVFIFSVYLYCSNPWRYDLFPWEKFYGAADYYFQRNFGMSHITFFNKF